MSKEVESVTDAGTPEIRQVYTFYAALSDSAPIEFISYPSQTSHLINNEQAPWACLLEGEESVDAPKVEVFG